MACEIPPRSARRVAGGLYFSAVFWSLETRPLGRLEDDDVQEEPAAPLPSMREDRDLRLTGDDVDATKAGLGELCLVLGVEPLAIGEAAAAADDDDESASA